MDTKYTIRNLAEKLKVSERTILREIQRGNIKTEKVGRRHLVSEKEAQRYLSPGASQTLPKDIERFLNGKKSEMITLLQRMVSMPTEDNQLGQEGRLAQFIKSFLEEKGIRTILYHEGDAVAVRGTYGFAEKGILLDCPLDTTPAGDASKWSVPPYEGVVKGNRMYGRGTADSKAGIVSMIYAVLALKKFIPEDEVRVELIFDGGEQNGEYLGMKLALSKGLYADCGIVGYAGDELELPIGARGYHRFSFTTQGKAAHTGGRVRKGINAISKMAKFISEVESIKLPTSRHPLFPFGQRLTFAMIGGGKAINITPDECWARLDVRTTPDFNRSMVEQLLKDKIASIKKKDGEFKIEYKYDIGEEGYVILDSNPFVKILRNEIEQILKKKLPLIATGPAHIGNLLAHRGIPVVLWGPRGGNVHSYDEYVEIDSLAQTSHIYVNTVQKYFGYS